MSIASHVARWQPGTVIDADPMHPSPAAALAAVLGSPQPAPVEGEALPALWHWVYFLTWPAAGELGADGHPRSGPFLPPIPDRRRVFAGGRCSVHRPLMVGREAQRTAAVSRYEVKQGRTGELLLVTVRSEFRQDSQLAAVEEQDIIYRSGEATVAGDAHAGPTVGSTGSVAAPAEAGWRRERFSPDPALLFRFSALTANSHRIHYDRPYATEVEHYPGLVVHGPLLALLMTGLAARHLRAPLVRVTCSFRRPVFVEDDITVGVRAGCGGAELMTVTTQGRAASGSVVAQ
jgi:3-methylfumaryl-CoA hydratase